MGTGSQKYRDMMILAIHQLAQRSANLDLIQESTLYAIVNDKIPRLYQKATLNALVTQKYLELVDLKTKKYAITSSLIDAAEELLNPKTSPLKNLRPSSSPATPQTFSAFRDYLLIALAVKDAGNSLRYYDLKEIALAADLGFRKGWVRKAAYYFRDHGYIQDAFTMGGDEDDNLSASLTGDGLAEAEDIVGGPIDAETVLLISARTNLDEASRGESSDSKRGDILDPVESTHPPQGSPIDKESEGGETAYEAHFPVDVATEAKSAWGDSWGRSSDRTAITSVPAADRKVPLDHNSDDYRAAIRSLDEVIEEFRSDHYLDNQSPSEKGALLKTLEAGRDLLNDEYVNVRLGVALLIEPLTVLAKRYEHALIGALASTVIDLLLKLFGLS